MNVAKQIQVTVVGKDVSKTPIWKKVLMFVGEDNITKTEISAHIKIDGQFVTLKIAASQDLPQTQQDGIIFTEPQSDPQKSAINSEAKACLFVNSEIPNPQMSGLTCLYTNDKEVASESEYDILDEFLGYLVWLKVCIYIYVFCCKDLYSDDNS